MKRRWAVTVAASCLAPSLVHAAGWSFDDALDVSAARGDHIFHHLESAGRKSIAVRDGAVAVAWEDNRDGAPRCYVAIKLADAPAFRADQQISGNEDCFEPSIAAVTGQRFLVAWEEGGQIRSRAVAVNGAGLALGDTIQLSDGEAAQASVGASADVIYAAWTQKDGKFSRVNVARLGIQNNKVNAGVHSRPDPAQLKDDQLYPTIAPGPKGDVTVAWEDRRKGHTLIVQAYSADGKQFEPWHQINETRSAAVPATTSRNRNLGRGPGAMRAALARIDDKQLGVVWLDKRDFLSGYDVYAAFSDNGGRSFGKNEKAQDSFGDTFAQWHPAIAAGSGQIAVAWDDDRDGTSDVWLSWKAGDDWVDNVTPKPAAGPGAQSDPSLAIDEHGDLHLVWIDRQETNGPTRIRYLRGRK